MKGIKIILYLHLKFRNHRKHMEELKFSFYSARKEMNNFLDLGILTEDDKSRITFRFSCFSNIIFLFSWNKTKILKNMYYLQIYLQNLAMKSFTIQGFIEMRKIY